VNDAFYAEWAKRHKEVAAFALQLGERPADLLKEYCELVDDTVEALAESGSTLIYLDLSPENADFFLDELDRAHRDRPELASSRMMALSGRWWRYARHYHQVVERSPLMELESYLHQLSESHAFMSWHDDVELMAGWLDAGASGPLPISDNFGFLTDRIVGRLSAIRRATGGWLYEHVGGIYFLTDQQAKAVSSDDDSPALLEEARNNRPSFEGC
jgi:hypothetical protein